MKRIADRIFLILMALAVLGTLVGLGLGSELTTSFFENRPLADMPEATGESLRTGETFTQWDAWMMDHLNGRDEFLKWNTAVGLRLYRRPAVSDLVVSADVLLPHNQYNYWDDSYLQAEAQKMAAHWKILSDHVETNQGKFYYLGLPLQNVYFYQHYPHYMENGNWYEFDSRAAFFPAMEAAGVRTIDMTTVYESMGYPDDLYSAVDHHYTYQGAFTAYQVLMNTINQNSGLGLFILEPENLVFTTLPNPYLGSNNRKLYGLWPTHEKLEIAVLADPIPFTRTDNGVAVDSSLFQLPPSESEWVTYNTYMGGDIAETIVDTGRDGLPKLLLFGDSFTNPLETLIYASFGESRFLDLRHYTEKSLADYIAEYQPDVVVCVRDSSTYYSTTGNGNFY